MATNHKILIAVMSCAMHRKTRVQWQRETWLRLPCEVDVRFFYGNHTQVTEPDEVVLDAPDDYINFPLKVKAMMKWSLEQGYDWVLKVDDDCYVVPERLEVPVTGHYQGRRRGPSGGKQFPYASGFAYWTYKHARKLAIQHKWDYDAAEDRYLGNLLADQGIACIHEPRFAVHQSRRNFISSFEGPRVNNKIAVSCEYENQVAMQKAHHDYVNQVPADLQPGLPSGPFENLDVLIKTFLRDGYLGIALTGLEANFPSARIIVVDDGYHARDKANRYAQLQAKGHCIEVAPYDTGFGAKSNIGRSRAEREFMLIGSDDFVLDAGAASGVEKMLQVLKDRPDIGWVGGRVDAKPYEGDFTEVDGVVTETPKKAPVLKAGNVEYVETDLTVNWGIIRTSLFRQGLHWCPEWKIGGDHFMFFDALKKLGVKAACVPSANVRTLPNNPAWKDASYDKLRGRAWDALPSFFKHRGIKKYVMFDGSWEELTDKGTVKHFFANGQLYREVEGNSLPGCSVCGL